MVYLYVRMRPSDLTVDEGSRALPSPLRLVIIDRDRVLVASVRARAHARGWESHELAHRTTRRFLARTRIHALVIDPAALGDDPWDWVGAMIAGLPGLAVVVCAAGSTVSERVSALQLGVDDWLEKPFHPDEVIARIESAVRRRRAAELDSSAAEPILAGELEIRAGEQQVYVDGVSVDLTSREFAVLSVIAAQKGTVVPRELIYLRVWGYSMVKGDRSVDVYVRKVRNKLRQISPGWDYIHTQVRVGYRLAPEPAGEPTHATTSEPSP